MSTNNLSKQQAMQRDMQLIAEVKKHPNLYDRKDLQFKHKLCRDEAWAQISANLDIDEGSCRTRWRSIRDRFVKLYAKKQADGFPDDANSNEKEWYLMSYLDFLIEYVITRPLPPVPEQLADCGINDEQLIAEVRKHQSIFAKNTLAYRNKYQRARAWATISRNLNTEEPICQRRWRSIRDRYVKVCSKRNSSGGNMLDDTDDTDWYLLPHLEFLNDYIGKKKLSTSLKKEPQLQIVNVSYGCDVENDFNNVDDYTIESNAWNNSCPPLVAAPSQPPAKRRRTETEIQGEIFTITDCPSPSITESINCKSELDVNEQMCSVLDRIRVLSEENLKIAHESASCKNVHFLKMVDEKLEQISYDKREDAKMFILNYLHKLTKE